MKSIARIDDVKQMLLVEMEMFRGSQYQSTFQFNEIISNQLFNECRLMLSKLNQKFPNELEVHEELLNSRTVKEFLEAISYGCEYGRFDEHIKIANIFNQYANYLEDRLYEVSIIKVEPYIPEELTFDVIRETLKWCDDNIENGDYGSAITNAKTLIESVFKELLNEFGQDTERFDSFPTLKKDVFNKLKMSTKNEDYDKSLIKVISGLHTTIDGINSIRNIAGNGHMAKAKPEEHHAVLVVNAAKTVVTFLFQTYEYQNSKKGGD